MAFIADSKDITTLNARLLRKGPRHAIAFDLASIGELQFFEGVLVRYAEMHPEDIICVVHHGPTRELLQRELPSIWRRLLHVPDSALRAGLVRGLDMFVTSEQYDLGVPGILSVCLFHGQPSKGLTFSREIVQSFDAFFLYGPLQRQALDEFTSRHSGSLPQHLRVYEVGYTKSDDLLNGMFSADEVFEELRLDRTKKTVLYAPAFNPGASLRELGRRVLDVLSAGGDYNVIAKLPIDCSNPTSDWHATGGIEWTRVLAEVERDYPRFRQFTGPRVDKLLACADVLVTCVSSVSFEFLALGKPVVFIDTPRFFSDYLKQKFPEEDTVAWADRVTVNAGREFGLTVRHVEELPAAIEEVLSHPESYPRRKADLRKFLLYNPGSATDVAVHTMEDLLKSGARPQPRERSPEHGTTIWRRVARAGGRRLIALANHFLHPRGYSIARTSAGYLDARATVAAAEKANLSLCDYLESRDRDGRKIGRRDSIIKELTELGVFENCRRVCEIGAGTGMYIEKVLEIAKPGQYEVYETATDWREYLGATYGHYPGCELLIRPADGRTLALTQTSSCDLVHAHAVFVYIPLLQVLDYLRECARVCRPGGFVVFDCILDRSFDYAMAKAWLASPWRFPVLLPERVLSELFQESDLRIVHPFTAPYGPGFVDYYVLRKKV